MKCRVPRHKNRTEKNQTGGIAYAASSAKQKSIPCLPGHRIYRARKLGSVAVNICCLWLEFWCAAPACWATEPGSVNNNIFCAMLVANMLQKSPSVGSVSIQGAEPRSQDNETSAQPGPQVGPMNESGHIVERRVRSTVSATRRRDLGQ